MSRHYSAVANETARIIKDVNILLKNHNYEELENLYGIIVEDDGTVFDITYQLKFETVSEWAEFSAKNDGVDDAYEDEYSKYSDEYE